MDMKVKKETSINLSSLVNSHEKPFVVIDKNYCILAVNKAYLNAYGASSENALGRTCYEVSHGKKRPCHLEGEDCPHKHIFKTGEAKACTHLHIEKDHHMHQVRISAFPLRDPNNNLLMGEILEETTQKVNHRPSSERMVGESPKFIACVDQLNTASSSDAPVLLEGETGTGKELAAEYIHSHSYRSHKPFQIVDSTVLTENLFESEMFGHVNGAYTGSVGAKQGLFEMAEGGTIFLDEISDMPILQQAKLLRVLETGEYRPVGGKKTRKADVRVICATNRNLWTEVLAGNFRQDMYYRIACLNITLPTLRDRINDITVLARNLLLDINRSMHRSFHLLPDVFERLKEYTYPGNIRELRNILFIAATHSKNHEIDATLIDKIIDNLVHSKEETKETEINSTNHIAVASEPLLTTISDDKLENSTTLKSIEKKHIRNLLSLHQGNRKRVADILGISERTIYRKLKRLEID